jgi:hypothetical protein
VVNFHGSESLSNFQVRKYIGNGYIMNLVVLIVPFIVYCVIMWSCPGNMPKYYPGLRDILPVRRG